MKSLLASFIVALFAITSFAQPEPGGGGRGGGLSSNQVYAIIIANLGTGGVSSVVATNIADYIAKQTLINSNKHWVASMNGTATNLTKRASSATAVAETLHPFIGGTADWWRVFDTNGSSFAHRIDSNGVFRLGPVVFESNGFAPLSDFLTTSNDLDSLSTAFSVLESFTESATVALTNGIALKQDSNAHLTDLSDGTLTGSKVGTGINGDNITSGTVADARIASTITRDSEWDTIAELEAVLGIDLLVKTEIDTEAEFEAKLFELPSGGGGSSDGVFSHGTTNIANSSSGDFTAEFQASVSAGMSSTNRYELSDGTLRAAFWHGMNIDDGFWFGIDVYDPIDLEMDRILSYSNNTSEASQDIVHIWKDLEIHGVVSTLGDGSDSGYTEWYAMDGNSYVALGAGTNTVGTNILRLDIGLGGLTKGQQLQVHSRTVFGTTNFIVLTNVPAFSAASIPTNATSATLEFGSIGEYNTWFHLTTNLVISPTNLVVGQTMKVYFDTNAVTYDVTVTNTAATPIHWNFNVATNGSTSITKTNNLRARLFLTAETNGIITADFGYYR